MDCAQFEELLHDLDRPGTEGFARREAALTHAESCSRCAILVMQSESLDVALQALSKRESGREASPLVAATLMEEFQRPQVRFARPESEPPIAALGATAAVLLALGFWLHFSHSQTPQIAINEQPSASIASSPAPAQVPANSAQPCAGRGLIHLQTRQPIFSVRASKTNRKRRRVHSLALRRRLRQPR